MTDAQSETGSHHDDIPDEAIPDGKRKFSTIDELFGCSLRIDVEGDKRKAGVIADDLTSRAKDLKDFEEDRTDELECAECDETFSDMEAWQDHHFENHFERMY